VPAEVDLRPRVVAAAFERDDHALAELGVEHALPRAQPVRRRRRRLRAAPKRRDAAGADDRLQAEPRDQASLYWRAKPEPKPWLRGVIQRSDARAARRGSGS
jgi:hypothetical protein